jgi:calcineurin-like phosphoesterase family protein
MIWLTSDTHFDDEKTLIYRYRPFDNVEEMNDTLVENWNKCVNPNDLVLHLGDFAVTDKAIEKYAPRLNGEIRLILGNHDEKRDRDLLEKYFTVVEKPHIINFTYNGEPEKLWICHYPLQRKNVKYSGIYNCCGHIHDLWKTARKMLNVGVDVWNFTPISLDVVMKSRQAELDGHWDANVYPDAPIEWQWKISNIKQRNENEPTLDILRKKLD